MNKTIAAAAVAASLTAGIAGMALATPVLAGAQTAADEAVSWVDEALDGLVGDGTITQAQADAVETALEDARPERGMHGHRAGRHLDVVAEALGMSQDELRTALEDGETIAEVASAEGVDVQTVIDALVAAKQARLDEAVADGEITQEEADERIARATERITAMVNGEMPRLGRGGRGGHHGDGGAPVRDDVTAEEDAAS